MRIVLLRHGKTLGNEAHRYVGRTDEGLTEASRRQILGSREAFWQKLLQLNGPAGEAAMEAAVDGPGGERSSPDAASLPALTLWVSPLRRARETAALLCPGLSQRLVPDFREMDFGRFEYRNYAELMADPESAGIYQRFIDSGGTSAFPEGESREDFSERVCRAYEALLPELFSGCAGAGDRALASAGKAAERPKHGCAERTLLIVAHGGTLMALLERFGLPQRAYFDWQCACLSGFTGELAMDGSITGLAAFRFDE